MQFQFSALATDAVSKTMNTVHILIYYNIYPLFFFYEQYTILNVQIKI